MSGWEKVAAATVLAVMGLFALNVAIWRRMRATTQAFAQTIGGELPRSVQQVRDEEEEGVDALHLSAADPSDTLATSEMRDR